MREKIVSILVCMLLITSGVFFVFKNSDVKADPPGDGEGELTSDLDFDYMWNVTTYLADIIHDENVYENGELKKGRYFGSDGDRQTSYYLWRNFTETCGFNENDVRKVRLENIEGDNYKDTDYTELVKVTSYQLTINHDTFEYDEDLNIDEHMSIAAVRAGIECVIS